MNSYATKLQDRWDVGMPLPPGTALSSKQLQRDFFGSNGSGQLADPMALWVCNPQDDAVRKGIQDIVQRVAVKVGLTHAWIRSKVHNYGFEYDEFGNRIPLYDDYNGDFIGYKIVRKDAHITVDFGHDIDNIAVHGHIYVKADAEGVPTGLMDMGTRKYIADGDERILELWQQTYWPQQHRAGGAKPEKPSCGRPQWQEEFLLDHYCPCPHNVDDGDDHYCPCPHIEALRLDHYCPNDHCPHDDLPIMLKV